MGHHWDADPANPGDYDINISSPTMKGKLDELGIAPSEKYGGYKTKDINRTFEALDQFRTKWSSELGRDVNFVGYPKSVARDSTEYILRAQGAANSVIKETGARRVFDPTSLDAWNAVEGKYVLIRANTADVTKISQNIGWSESRVARIKEHVFF